MNLEQLSELQQTKEQYLVVISATWCQPCKTLKKTIQTITEKYPELQNKIYTLDVEQSEDLVQEFNINSVPTILYIQNNTIEQKQGTQTEKQILNFFGKN